MKIHSTTGNKTLRALLPSVALMAATSLLLGGCGQPQSLQLQRLDPKAPAANGLPALPLKDQPSPLTVRAPFGLYAEAPTSDTLDRLAIGPVSPDGRFRAALTDQGVWVARVDGAWLWQVELPPLPVAPTANNDKKKTTADKNKTQATPPKATRVVSNPAWTFRGSLVFQDDTGRWLEADPVTASVGLAPADLQGKEIISFSPDGKRVLYYVTTKTAKQLWVANANGSQPKFLGENMTGSWDEKGNPVATKIPTPQPPATAGTPQTGAAAPGATGATSIPTPPRGR